MAEAKVVILGGGPAGVSAAYRLHRQRRGHALVVEAKDQFGGNAGSFYSEGQWLDYGSHRLDPRTAPDVLTDLKRLLGADLADRPRRDQLRFGGRWFSFPLQPKDLVLRLDPRFTARAARDIVLRAVTKRPKSATKDTLAAVTESNVGATIANGYFFPYAQKVWGQGVEALHGPKSFEWLRNALKPARADRFYYPREGFGQISRAYADAARDAGADLRLNTKVVGLYPAQKGWKIELKTERRVVSIEADYVWSTLPMTVVAGLMKPAPPEAVRRARTQVGHRALLLVYLHLDVPRFHEADAHYFPETDVKMTRLSEPKRYFGASEPRDGTTLCAEIPCQVDDALWTLSDDELGRIVQEDLQRIELPLSSTPVRIQVVRIPYAYPVLHAGYETDVELLEAWLSALPRFLSYGRLGLFQHDNTHHALAMAYAAVDCLQDGAFDIDKWAEYRRGFRTHVADD